MKRKTKLTLLIAVISITTIIGQGPPPPPPPGCASLPEGCPDAPIDGGILYLLLAGVYIGVKKLRKN